MARHIMAEDEQGYSWIVFGEDRAWPLITKLPKTVDYYVLPRESLISGEIRPVDRPFFYVQEIDHSLLTADLKRVIIRLDRLYKTARFLGDVTDGDSRPDSEILST